MQQCVSHPEERSRTDTQFERGVDQQPARFIRGSTEVTAPRLDPGETELSLSAQSQPEPWNPSRHPS